MLIWRKKSSNGDILSQKATNIGYKLTLVIEYPSLRPVAFLLHQGSPGDAKIYEEILEEIKRRRIARDGDTIIFDKGYYGYKNYAMVISRFKLIPVIFPRKNFKMEKSMVMLSYPISIFNRSNPEKEKEFYRGLVKSLAKNAFSLLTQRRNYRRLPNGSWWRGLKFSIS